MAETDFKVHFDVGESHEIEAATLIDSLMGFSYAIQDIQSKMSPGTPIKIKVKALEKGSFIMFLGIHANEILSSVKELFTRENVTLTAAILASLVHAIALKKHLKGEAPKAQSYSNDGQEISVTNQEGQTIVVHTTTFNLYTSTPSLDRNLSKAFEAIEKEENITSVNLTDSENTPIVSVPKEEFPKMRQANVSAVGNSRTITKEGVRLNATKLSWDQSNKWSFIYEGNKINAQIMDENFFKLINEGRRFAKGDTIIADIEVVQQFDESVNAFVNKSYTVLKVSEHLPRPEQLNIELDS